jgi:hypothetical protein
MARGTIVTEEQQRLFAGRPREPVSFAPGDQARVERDTTDARDFIFTPSLRPLAPGGHVFTLLRNTGKRPGTGLRVDVRDQREEGHCVGHALAACIDIQRTLSGVGGAGERVEPVSARMLYEMARVAEPVRSQDGVHSLRSALKGFWHNGVCLASAWPDSPSGGNLLTAERSKQARCITLGGYLRVRTVLQDFHAALSEAGTLLVSASIHDGWEKASVRTERGRIRRGPDGSGRHHAFAIIGYDSDGFLVLNSWGDEWGGFQSAPGIAHWSYEDWGNSVMDAWAIQLGASAPTGFDLGRDPQGRFGGSLSVEEARRVGGRSVPRTRLIGHYAHLDDGCHVMSGNYPSSRGDVNEAFDSTPEKGRGPILLWFAGGLEGFDATILECARRKVWAESYGLYPYFVIWAADVVDAAVPVLDALFEMAIAKVGRSSGGLAAEIERTTRGLGRSVWRDLKMTALATGGDGDARHVFDTACSAGRPLHLVADGMGAIVLAAIVSSGGRCEGVASTTLVAPAMTMELFRTSLLPSLKRMMHVKIIIPSKSFEEMMVVETYPRSILRLISRSFEAPAAGGLPPAMVGIDDGRRQLTRLLPKGVTASIDLPPKGDGDGSRTYPFSALTASSQVMDAILKNVMQKGE